MTSEVKIVGVGGGGCSVVESIAKMGVNKPELIAIDTVRPQSRIKAVQYIQIGSHGTNGDWQKGKEAAQDHVNTLFDVLDGADEIMLVSAFGGGTGTGATAIIAQVAKDTNAFVRAIISRPFMFEGTDRQVITTKGVDALRGIPDDLTVLSNDRLLSLFEGDNYDLLTLFSLAADALVWQVLSRIA